MHPQVHSKTEGISKMAEKKEKAMSIEETFTKLDETVARLEAQDISLEDSLKLYEQGMQYVRACNEAIDLAEKKVLVIRENGELDEF